MTETLSKLFLELAHAVPEGTKTFRELALEKRIEELEAALDQIAATSFGLDAHHTEAEALEHYAAKAQRYQKIARDVLKGEDG